MKTSQRKKNGSKNSQKRGHQSRPVKNKDEKNGTRRVKNKKEIYFYETIFELALTAQFKIFTFLLFKLIKLRANVLN